jgi:hypothetical protein
MTWHPVSALSYYPHFLAYTNEAGPGRDRGYELFTSANLDLGQGLLEMKRWMRANQEKYVYLAYHGVADPAGYGIRYVPLPSWFPLDDAWPPPDSAPNYVAISVQWIAPGSDTNNPYVRYRTRTPAAVVGHVFMVYETGGRPPDLVGLLPPVQ